MSAILTPVGLLLIILAGYLFKRFGLFGQKDYRVLQTAEFNIVLPGAIVYSFATNPHDISLLLISVFAFLFAFIPVVFIFLATRKRNVTDRAFLMLNGAGFNLGCFSFPVVQSFWGAGAVGAGCDVRYRQLRDGGRRHQCAHPATAAYSARQNTCRTTRRFGSHPTVRKAQGSRRQTACPPAHCCAPSARASSARCRSTRICS